jgi:hypothetical protein
MYNQEDAPTDELKIQQNYQEFSFDDINKNSTINRAAEAGIVIGGASAKKNKIDVELGDVIELCAPSNADLHNRMFFVEFVDLVQSKRIQLIDVESPNTQPIVLEVDSSGNLKEPSIKVWTVLSRAEERGYARLYGFLPKRWINIFFAGELPMVITGQITNLEEDMIEVTPFERDAEPIYIDFAYRGLPPDLGIVKIELREQPQVDTRGKTLSESQATFEGNREASIEFNADGEAIFEVPDNVRLNDNHLDNTIKEVVAIIEEDGEEFTVQVAVPEHEKVYGIKMQLAALMNAMLNRIPKSKRTPAVMQRIHKLLENFEYIRSKYFVFNENQQIVDKVPAKQSELSELNQSIDWLIPVASVKKKIYHSTPVMNAQGATDIVLIEQIDSLKEELASFENTVSGENELLYNLYRRRLTESQRPIESAANVDDTVTAIERPFEAVIENQIPFQSNVSRTTRLKKTTENRITQRAFNIQPLSKGDTVTAFTKYITFPQTVIEYSRSALPTATILERVERPVLSTRDWINTYRRPLLIASTSPMKGGSLDEVGLVERPDKLAYNLTDLFRQFAGQLTTNVSVIEMLRLLEPFLIYTDNLKYADLVALAPILNQRISLATSSLAKSLAKPAKKLDTVQPVNALKALLTTPDKDANKEVNEILSKTYKVSLNEESFSEALLRTNDVDMGALLHTLIHYLLYYLISPDALGSAFNEDALNIEDTTAPIYNKNDYSKYYLAKKYLSKTALENDNRIDAFVDKEFDKTPYDIYTKRYKSSKKKYSDEDFREWIIQNLIAKHGFNDPAKAEKMAKTLIAEKKKVEDHDIAILEEIPKLKPDVQEHLLGEAAKKELAVEAKHKTRITFYERLNNEWTLREDWSTAEDPIGIMTSFCNVSSKNKKATEPAEAEPAKDKVNIVRSIGEKTATLVEQVAKLRKKAQKADHIQQAQHLRLSIQQFDIGATIKDTGKPPIQSPHVATRQLILTEPDFSLKQTYIVRFFIKFCRFAERASEDPHWGYCRDTNTKLFPLSLYQLAVAFGEGRFQQRLDEMILQIGEKSGDGDTVIDKFTGYPLKRLDYSTDEGFDDAGFKITTHSIMEKDAFEIALKEIGKRVFDNPTAEKVDAIFHLMRIQTGLKDDDKEIESAVMQQSIRILCNPSRLPTECSLNEGMFLTEREFTHNEQAKKKKNDKYKPTSYTTYVNRNVIATTVGMFLVAVQTSFSIAKPRRVFPNCKYSFNGYPHNGDKNNLDGITFLSCVIQGSARRDTVIQKYTEMWSSITGKTFPIEALVQNVLDVLTYCMESDPYIRELYNRKAEFDRLRLAKQAIPDELALGRWTKYLPPLVSLKSMANPRELDGGFHKALDKAIANGRRGQDLMIHGLSYKARQFSFGVLERIQRIINDKGSAVNLLHKSFIQNSCCNDTNIIHPMTYYIGLDPVIKTQLLHIIKVERMLTDYNLLAKGRLLSFPLSSAASNANKAVSLEPTYSEKTIYKTFIAMCNIDRGLPPPVDYADLCIKKPTEYVATDPIDKKISILKANNVNLGLSQFNQLMDRVHKKNVLIAPPTKEFNVFQRCAEFLQGRFNAIDPIFSQHLIGLVQQCSPKTSVIAVEDIDNPKNEELNNFIDYLVEANKVRVKVILDFLKSNVAKETTERAMQFVKRIGNQQKLLNNHTTGVDERNVAFVRASVRNMSTVYPQMVLNKATTAISAATLDRWKFSERHTTYLKGHTNQTSASLARFFDDNEIVVNDFLKGLDTPVFQELIDVLPTYREIQISQGANKPPLTCYNTLNQTAIDLVLKYAWLSTVAMIVEKSGDPELGKRSQREQVQRQLAAKAAQKPIDVAMDNVDPLMDVYDDVIPELNFNDLTLFRAKVARMVEAFLELEQGSLKLLDFDYAEIKNNSFRISELEKKALFTKIGKLKNPKEKELEKLFRRLKLGEYYVDTKMIHNPDYFVGKEAIGVSDDDLAVMQEQEHVAGLAPVDEAANNMYDADGVEEDRYGEVGFGGDDE